MKRGIPRGIKILASLLIIFSIIAILILPFSISLILKGEMIIFPEKSLQFNKIYNSIIGILALIQAVIFIVLAAGVLKLKEKYRKFLVGFIAFVLALSIINIIIKPFLGIAILLSLADIFTTLISLGFYVLVLWYFNKSEVKAVFR